MTISKNIKGSTELTLLADIKPDFVEVPDPMTYGTRLQTLLGNLFDMRKTGIETGATYVGPLERLRSIHFVRWAVLDRGKRLLLAVTFDRPWEPYIREIVDRAGPILDGIFSHCVGYDGHSARDGYEAFAEWVKAAQQACDFWFAAFPGVSVDDIYYLRNLKSSLEHCTKENAALRARVDNAVFKPLGPSSSERWLMFFETAVGLYRMRTYFPENAVPDRNYSDRAIYDRLSSSVLRGLVNIKPDSPSLSAEPSTSQPKIDDGYETIPALPVAVASLYTGMLAWYDKITAAPVPAPIDAAGMEPARVQGGILKPYRDDKKPMTHGCIVLLKVDDDPRKFLEFLEQRLPEVEGRTRYNVGFTPSGLGRIGQQELTLRDFPDEFLQGMENRAGLLGDAGCNHPEQWRRPRFNADAPSAEEAAQAESVPLDSVDVVVILQKRAPGVEGDYAWRANHPLKKEVDELAAYATLLHVQPLRRYESWGDVTLDKDKPLFDPGSDTTREHFGYLDGFSQPNPAALTAKPKQNDVAYGELFVGQPDDRGEARDLQAVLKNGTFVALRKLSQDVEAFNTFIESRKTAAGNELRSKIMGRDVDGTPAGGGDRGNNDFDYNGDQAGYGCPLQAHVRLANPRTPAALSAFGRRMRTPRILRRGFSYGPLYRGRSDAQAKLERGTVFLALVADLGQQYEVVQRWLNGANSSGLDSSQRCPITGPHDIEGGTTFRWRARAEILDRPSDKANHTNVVRNDLPQFVRLEWGMYFFMPTLDGLRTLKMQAEARLTASSTQALGLRQQVILAAGQSGLGALIASDAGAAAWRLALEEQGTREQSFAILNAIRANHRVLKTKDLVFVAGHAEALEVLTDEQTYSVREYWRRMHGSGLPMHLGMDSAPLPKAVCPAHSSGHRLDEDYVRAIGDSEINYARESVANDYLHRLTREEGFKAALAATRKACDIARTTSQGTIERVRALPNVQEPTDRDLTLNLMDLANAAEKIVSSLCNLWFGFPDGKHMLFGGEPNAPEDPLSYCPYDFTVFSQHVFRPSPDEATARLAATRGERVLGATQAALNENRQPNGRFGHPFFNWLAERVESLKPSPKEAEALITRSVYGAVDGFSAATFGSYLSIIGQWLELNEIFNVQHSCRAEIAKLRSASDAASLKDSKLLRLAVEKLKVLPKPPWLHRVAVRDTLLGNVSIKAGDLIAVHLGQAAFEGGVNDLFGGRYDAAGKCQQGGVRTPLHACPAQELALGVLLGMLVGTLELKNVTQVNMLVIGFAP